MTLAEFRATRTECADLGATLNDEAVDGVSGFIYAGTLYIESYPTTGLVLTLENEQTRGDLADLEARLYDWAIRTEAL